MHEAAIPPPIAPHAVPARRLPRNTGSASSPHRTKHNAVLYAVAARPERTWTNVSLCVYHPKMTPPPTATTHNAGAYAAMLSQDEREVVAIQTIRPVRLDAPGPGLGRVVA